MRWLGLWDGRVGISVGRRNIKKGGEATKDRGGLGGGRATSQPVLQWGECLSTLPDTFAVSSRLYEWTKLRSIVVHVGKCKYKLEAAGVRLVRLARNVWVMKQLTKESLRYRLLDKQYMHIC